MFWWRRADGDLVKDSTDLRRMMPYIMRTRSDSAVYFEQRIDVRAAERFVRAFNQAHPETRATLFHVILWAARDGVAEFPGLNRFVAGGRLYQRKGIWISYSAKQRMKKGAPLMVLKRRVRARRDVRGDGRVDGRAAAVGEVRRREVEHRRRDAASILALPGFLRRVVMLVYRMLEANGMFPKFFVDGDALYSSVFLTDLGSLGMDPAYHHLYEYGTIGIFGAVGRARTELVGDPNTGPHGAQAHRTVRWSFDERVEDGLYAGYGLKHVQRLIEDPVKGGIADGDDATLAVLGAAELDLTAAERAGHRRRSLMVPGRAAPFPGPGSPPRTTSPRRPARRCSHAAATRSTRSSAPTSRSASSRRTTAATAATSSPSCGTASCTGTSARAGRRRPRRSTRCATRSARRHC